MTVPERATGSGGDDEIGEASRFSDDIAGNKSSVASSVSSSRSSSSSESSSS